MTQRAMLTYPQEYFGWHAATALQDAVAQSLTGCTVEQPGYRRLIDGPPLTLQRPADEERLNPHILRANQCYVITHWQAMQQMLQECNDFPPEKRTFVTEFLHNFLAAYEQRDPRTSTERMVQAATAEGDRGERVKTV